MPTNAEPGRSSWLTRYLESLLKLFGSSSLQGATCLSSGGALVILMVLLERPIHHMPLVLLSGMAFPLLFFRLLRGYWTNPERVLERQFHKWDSWVTKKIISKNECEKWKREERSRYRHDVDQRRDFEREEESDGGTPGY